jgi:hypothetical protein
VGNNRYDAWQTSLNKRFGGGLTVSAAYSWGRLRSGTENVGLFYGNWKAYTGYIASTDRRHITTVNYTYEFPKVAQKLGWNNRFGGLLLDQWQVAHMMTFFSGQGFSPGFSIQQASTTTGVDVSRVFLGTSDLSARLLPTGDPNSLTRDMAHQYDFTKLAPPAIGSDGTGPRNFINGRGAFSNDINLSKQFRVTEKRGLELRASFFNALNQVRRLGINTSTQYKALGKTIADGFRIINTPEANAAATSGDALKIYNAYRVGVGHVNLTSVEPMRIIEIGLKFRF